MQEREFTKVHLQHLQEREAKKSPPTLISFENSNDVGFWLYSHTHICMYVTGNQCLTDEAGNTILKILA